MADETTRAKQIEVLSYSLSYNDPTGGPGSPTFEGSLSPLDGSDGESFLFIAQSPGLAIALAAQAAGVTPDGTEFTLQIAGDPDDTAAGPKLYDRRDGGRAGRGRRSRRRSDLLVLGIARRAIRRHPLAQRPVSPDRIRRRRSH